ncbi:MAG: hypothetical protein A3B82_05335 [Methylophilales bacterium RIFCSPHIGHO2_02_FULL_57_10]|nr:MAG: hypothetical protein A3B82_05335 [Methylophilales bacterium RIFCSPHIGHO2_02_FULL_57_10]
MFSLFKRSSKRPLSLKTEITLALTIKLALLYGLWALCFSQLGSQPIDGDGVARTLLNKPARNP